MKKIFLIIVFGCLLPGLFCQAQNPPPIAPEMISVSVRPMTDTVVINWKPSITPGIDGYVVYEYRIKLGNWAYDSIWSVNDASAVLAIFKHHRVQEQPVKFFVAAYKINPPPYGFTASPHDLIHQTIFTKLTNDSCNSKVLITWSKYIGWGSNLGYYKIFQIKDRIDLQVVGDNILPSDTTYAVTVEANKSYCYYVCAIHKVNGTITSMSNDSCLYTKMAVPPSYIIADYASFNPNSQSPVKLKFSLDNLSQLKKYQLYTSDNATTGFVPVNSPITATADSILVQDSEIASSPKYYKLGVLNNCNNTVLMSNVATAMVPRAAVKSNNVNLVWNEYIGWYSGVQQYTVFRAIGNNPPQPIGNTSLTNFTDDITQLIGQQNSGNICYYVEATSNVDSEGKIRQSLSSNYCIDLSSLVWVPNAFTPNGDGSNDDFKPSFAFLPNDYVLIVYNRYGFKVFESTNSLIGWDGIIGKGQKAPEGTYVYFIRFSSQSGETVERRGNFSLIYP